jgi:hypothetical protein
LLALTGNAATMLIPIPFAGDVLQSSINNSVAEDYSEIYKNYYASIDVYSLALKEFKHHPEFSVTANARIRLYPYVVVQECEDKKYRLSLIMQIEKENWLGRYLYHLPTAYPVEDAKKPTQQELTTFTSELHTGVVKLVGLIQRDRQGSLKSTGNKVTFGSYHIVGYNLVAPANILKIKNADLIEEVNGKVIIRSDGDPTAAVGNYGLGFGVHYFDRQQLHTFDKQ